MPLKGSPSVTWIRSRSPGESGNSCRAGIFISDSGARPASLFMRACRISSSTPCGLCLCSSVVRVSGSCQVSGVVAQPPRKNKHRKTIWIQRSTLLFLVYLLPVLWGNIMGCVNIRLVTQRGNGRYFVIEYLEYIQ